MIKLLCMLSMLLLAITSLFFIASAAIMFLFICYLDPILLLDDTPPTYPLSSLLEFPSVRVTV